MAHSVFCLVADFGSRCCHFWNKFCSLLLFASSTAVAGMSVI